MSTHRARLRLARTVLGLLALGLLAVGLAYVKPALAGQYSQGNSSCTSREDPANLLIDYPKVYYAPTWAGGTVFDYTSGHTGGYAAAALSRQAWDGGLGSTSSWYNYGSNGGCVNQADYATNSLTSGHHVRYWMSAVGTRPAGAAHHDFMCGTNHSADQYVDSATNMANFLAYTWWPQYPGYSFNLDRSPSSFNKCGEIVPDDGWTEELDFGPVPAITLYTH